MSISLELVGKLSIGKESERFKPFEEQTYPSGWAKRTLKFNAICGDNRHFLTVGTNSGGCFKDGHGDVYVFSKTHINDKGEKIKGELFKIPFKERLTSPKLADVAEFKKYIIDLEKPNRRYLLKRILEKVNDGTVITDEELKAVGLTAEDNISIALEKSTKRHHEFITEYDYAEFLYELITSEKYKDKKFKIYATETITYSDKSQKYYTNIIPNRIYLAKDDEVEISDGIMEMYYTDGCIDNGSLEEKGKYYINGYVMEYNSDRKTNIPCPITVVYPKPIDEHSEKVAKTYLKHFDFGSDDSEVKQLGIKFHALNGSQRTEITEDMLDDTQQELLLLGEITMDDIRKELGNDVYGDKVQEKIMFGFARGWTKGAKETAYTVEDMTIKPTESDEETEGLFDDDEI